MSISEAVSAVQWGRSESRLGWALAGLGLLGVLLAGALRPIEARAAASQVWPPFVLVAGLLLIGLVADDDGLFAAAGSRLAATAPSPIAIFAGSTVMVGVVTALLNLDTAVAFLTPVLIYTARSRGDNEAPLLYGCLLLANAGSLFLPGSNLTNLIVLGQLHRTGSQFLAHMWAPGLAALLVTASVVAAFGHRISPVRTRARRNPDPPVLGVGLAAVVSAAVLILVLRSPALPVAGVGVGAVGARIATGRERLGHAMGVLGLPVLVGLFAVAVSVGALGRSWSGPTSLLSHLDAWGTAAVGALGAVVINNLPAAALLSARHLLHPYALLVGLDVGPNLLVTGSLAWFLWLRAARQVGARPSLATASRLGLLAAPLSIAAAVGVLTLLATH